MRLGESPNQSARAAFTFYVLRFTHDPTRFNASTHQRFNASMINIGLVGLGFMAATHLRAYRQVKGARVAALCNPSGRHLDGDFSKVAGNVGTNEPVKLDMQGIQATRHFKG